MLVRVPHIVVAVPDGVVMQEAFCFAILCLAFTGILYWLFYLWVALFIDSCWSGFMKLLYIDWDGIKRSMIWLVFFIAIVVLDAVVYAKL